MADARSVPPALRAAARFGLPVPPFEASITVTELDQVLGRARFDGLTGFLAGAVLDGLIDTDEGTATTIVRAWHEAMAGCVLVEAFTVRTAAVLDGADVRWRLTKGAALAHLDYVDPADPAMTAMRTFGDADLVVHPDDWTASLEVLTDSGLRRPAPELRPGYDRRFGKGATLVDDRHWEIDLHRRFAIGRFGVRSRMEELFDRRDEIVLAGRTIPVLAGPDRLLHACHHLVLGGFSGLRVARDVAQLLLVSDVDWRATVATAERWGVDAVVATGIAQAWARLALDDAHPAHDWSVDHAISRGDARAIRVFTDERPFREQALTAVPALPCSEVPAYLWALAVPTLDALHARGRTFAGHLRRAVRDGRRGLRGRDRRR